MATARPRIELDENGQPVFIDVISDDALRLIKPTGDQIDQVHEFMQVYGLEDPPELRQFEQQYLQRFNLTPDNPRYAQALAQLSTESNSQRVAVGTIGLFFLIGLVLLLRVPALTPGTEAK